MKTKKYCSKCCAEYNLINKNGRPNTTCIYCGKELDVIYVSYGNSDTEFRGMFR